MAVRARGTLINAWFMGRDRVPPLRSQRFYQSHAADNCFNQRSPRKTRRSRLVVRLRAAVYGSSSGETLVETLVSVLIVSAVVLMLCTSIVTAANIDAKAKQVDVTFNEADAAAAPTSDYTLRIGGAEASQAQFYESDGYVCYKHAKGE